MPLRSWIRLFTTVTRRILISYLHLQFSSSLALRTLFFSQEPRWKEWFIWRLLHRNIAKEREFISVTRNGSIHIFPRDAKLDQHHGHCVPPPHLLLLLLFRYPFQSQPPQPWVCCTCSDVLKYTSPYLVFVIYCLFYPSSNILLLHNHVNITVTDFSNMSQLSIQVET